jgi:hypothetical protein
MMQPLGESNDLPPSSFGIYGLMINELVPLNISEIPAEAIVIFRDKRRSEIAAFNAVLESLRKELMQIESADIYIDRIMSKAKDLERAMRDFKQSADLINAKKWMGVSFMGFPAPLALGGLLGLPVAGTVTLGLTGLAVGGVYNVNNAKESMRKLRAENPASLLVDLQSTFKKYTTSRGGGAMNFHAYNCMEQFVND